MTDRTTDPTNPAGPSDPDASGGHLVCAYSPRWLSGPTPYEGLVATFSPGADDEPDQDVVSPGSSA